MDWAREMLLSVDTELPDAFLTAFNKSYAPIGAVFDKWEACARTHVADFVAPETLQAYDKFLAEEINPLARRLPLMNPFHVLIIVTGYLLTVFGLRLVAGFLPDLRKSRVMRAMQVLHNGFLVVLSAYMCFEISRQAIIHGYSLWFNPQDNSSSGWPMAKVIWLFYISKVYEYLDTVIMLLRRNFRQVTFLHVYHHLSITLIGWTFTFFAPGGDSYFSGALNSFVHVVMYAYYLAASLGYSIPFKYSITYLQMTQFALNLIQGLSGGIVGIKGYPRLLCFILPVYMATLLILFANFLIRSRLAPSSPRSGSPQQRISEKKKI